MRKLILQMQVSVDGYVGQAGREPGWQLWDWGDKCPWDEKLRAEFNRFFEEADTILLSRKIVEGGYIDHWSETARKHPRAATFAFAQRIMDARKIIFSNILKASPWPEAELAYKPLVEEVDYLKAQPGKNIVAFGGAGFASSLITADLIDEFQFYTNPIALHEGISIFAKKSVDQDFELIGSNPYACGMVVTKYVPRGCVR
ncbi:dihydrofolate reductase family protein [Rhodanobacter sp. A1T4]|uniref:dihydrofolate reductase family protein n=1 Tax=Rhodanobacter sp. A1T4 TaxID=2723087 RepID=UPI0016073B05|nr:dihydrofolate reductase family protein [Rhodanobacter sp. A1T4]MBB6245660.1 dihydrofolate reductase [Rhodanobacter sp. A1T4]